MRPRIRIKPDLGCYIYLRESHATGTLSHILRIWPYSLTFRCMYELWISKEIQVMTLLPRACGRTSFKASLLVFGMC